MKRAIRYLLALIIFIALALGAAKVVYWAMHPFRAADAEMLADEIMRKHGGRFTQILFDDLGDERYKVVYRRGANERVDVIVDNGIATVQEGLPMKGALDLGP
jgi:hypothetical protein